MTEQLEFSTEEVEEAYHKVLDDLTEEFGTIYASDEVPLFVIPGEELEIRVIIAPITGDAAVIRVVAWLADGVNPYQPDLMRYLLEEGSELPFGRFGVDDDGEIFFDITIHSEGYTQKQLSMAIATVHAFAAAADKELKEQYLGASKLN